MIHQFTLERYNLQPTTLQPVYKLTVDLAQQEVIWQGREHVQTRGRVVAELNKVQLTTLQQMLEELKPDAPEKACKSKTPQVTYGELYEILA